MVILGVGAFGVLALLGVDASELLRDCWWSGGVGPSRLQTYVLTLALRKSFSVEKGCDRDLSPRHWRLWLWVLSRQSAQSDSSHWGKVLLRELLVLNNPMVYC